VLPFLHAGERPKVHNVNHTPSLYEDSYARQIKLNQEAIRNPGREHAITKSLYQPDTTGTTMKDLLAGDRKWRQGTSYNFDYRNQRSLEQIIPLKLKELRLPMKPKNPTAEAQYTQWTQS
jgi:hypothetical protein